MGPEEVRARQLLLEMMDLLSSDPYTAMGLIPSATASDIRSAFLTRTKQFHPARFGRMSSDIQRLANEVFLALRAVHENLAKPTVKTALRQSTPIPTLGARPGGAQGSAALRPLATQPLRPPSGPSPSLPGTQPLRPPTGPAPALGSRPVAQPFRQTETNTQPLPPRAPAPSPVPARPSVGARPAGPAGAGRPQPVVSAAGSDRELAPILELFAQQQLAAAKVALETLVARSPSTKNKALLAYAKGRAAQLDKRIDEARVELHEALTLDPDLQLAKTALAELFTRRR